MLGMLERRRHVLFRTKLLTAWACCDCLDHTKFANFRKLETAFLFILNIMVVEERDRENSPRLTDRQIDRNGEKGKVTII